jgi:hypothetical protein
MALSLDSIFQPLNAFFLDKFKAEQGAPVQFRLAAVPRPFVQSEFTFADGPSEAHALELVSQMVDGIATADSDEPSVRVDPASPISSFYETQLLAPAVACVGAEWGPEDHVRMREAFEAAKAEAIADWEMNKLGSVLSGQAGAPYRATRPSPQRWWNTADKDIWRSPGAFHIDAPPATAPPPGGPRPGLLKLRMAETKMQDIEDRGRLGRVLGGEQLRELKQAHADGAFGGLKGFRAAHAAAGLGRGDVDGGLVKKNVAMHAGFNMKKLGPFGPGKALGQGAAITTVAPPAADPAPDKPAAFDVRLALGKIPSRKLWQLQDMLAADAGSGPIEAPGIDVDFDYCVVDLTRRWLHEPFLFNPSWSVPGIQKGQLSANDGRGLAWLPVGFVAIKQLRIRAHWTDEDVSRLSNGYALGPFLIDSDVVEGSLRHDGIQIVGWFLKQLPALPPNADQND